MARIRLESLRHLHDDLAGPGSRIEIQYCKLLPGPEEQLAIRKGNRDGLPLELPTQVAVPIVLPGIARIVLPCGVWWNEAVPNVYRVGADARFVFDDEHRRRGVPDEDRHDAGSQRTAGQRLLHRLRDVFTLRASLHGNPQGDRLDRHPPTPSSAAATTAALRS